MELFFEEISLGNEKYFEVDNGERIRKQDIQKAKGDIPVYSSSKYKDEALGFVSDKIKEIVPKAKKFSEACITINADATDYSAFFRNETFYANDVLNVIKILKEKIYAPFIAFEINNILPLLDLHKDNKLYKRKLRELTLKIPIKKNGDFDLEKQKEIAGKYRKIEQIKNKLKEDFEKIKDMKIDINSKYETKTISITGEEGIFEAEKGNAKYTKEYIHNHKGEFPVYSSQTSDLGEIGSIDTFDYEEECFTWTTDGTYV